MSKENEDRTLPYTKGFDQETAFEPVDAHTAASGNGTSATRTDPDADNFAIIVHCHLRWDFVWQRPQQIFSRLARLHSVLFIEDPVIAEGEPRLDISEPHPNIVRIIPQIPDHLAVDSDRDAEIFAPLIRAALAVHPLLAGRFDTAVQWFYSPMSAPGYMGQFGTRGVVYDCMDELANFRNAPRDIVERERFVMSKANVVFTGGYQLFESKSRLHDNVHVYGCGVDVGHYGKARSADTALPEAVASLPTPRFGYFGVIDERLDYELIANLADRFPEASIVMAGPVAKVDANELPNRPNIHWLGQQRYEDLPSLVKGFDVCLMPFALNDATRYINPTKTLEYLAAGKPVVSTAIRDVVRNFTPIVEIAHTPRGFADAVGRAYAAPDPELIAQGLARADGASWDSTVESMRNDVRQAVSTLSRVLAVGGVRG